MSNPSADESVKEPNVINDPPKGEDPKGSEVEENQVPSQEEEVHIGICGFYT